MVPRASCKGRCVQLIIEDSGGLCPDENSLRTSCTDVLGFWGCSFHEESPLNHCSSPDLFDLDAAGDGTLEGLAVAGFDDAWVEHNDLTIVAGAAD